MTRPERYTLFRADGGSGSIVILKYIRPEVDCTPVLQVVLVVYRVPHFFWVDVRFFKSPKQRFLGRWRVDSWKGGLGAGRGRALGWRQRGGAWRVREGPKTDPGPATFLAEGYTEIGSRGNVFGTIFGFIFRTQNRPRFSASLKEPLSKSKKRPHFKVQKTDLKMVPKIARGFLVFGFDGVRFSTAGGSDYRSRGGQHGRARRGPEGRTGGQFWSNLRRR